MEEYFPKMLEYGRKLHLYENIILQRTDEYPTCGPLATELPLCHYRINDRN